MKKETTFLVLLLICCAVGLGPLHEDDWFFHGNSKRDSECPEWHYEEAAEWGALCETYASCDGMKQSPIDLRTTVSDNEFHIGDLDFSSYFNPNTTVLHNGHAINFYVQGGSATGGPMYGEMFNLVQFHYHIPSEHKVGGKIFDMEMHLVHQSATGDLAVVGILFEVGEENDWFNTFIEDLPQVKGDARYKGIEGYGGLPDSLEFRHYMGSLTTPPCSEGVKWIVLQEPQTVSEEQLEMLETAVYGNNRPTQDLNNRFVALDNGAEPCECHCQESAGPKTMINFNFEGMIPK